MEGQHHFVLHADLASRPAPRPRGSAGRRSYMPQAYAEWKETLAGLLAVSWSKVRPRRLRTLTGPVAVSMFLSGRGVTLWISDGPEGDRDGLRGDLDNHAKAVLDALVQAGVLGDDSQVWRLAAAFAPEPADG